MNDAPLLPGFGAPPIAPPSSSPYLERDTILADLQRRTAQTFSVNASRVILQHLEQHGPTSGEALTEACKAAGVIPIKPMDDRAFGPVYMKLARLGVIEKVGTATRLRGHGTSGGNVWAKVKESVAQCADCA